MITAKQARDLRGPSPKERVELIGKLIEAAAAAKKSSVALHDSFWVQEGYQSTNDYKEAVKILEDLGYKVRFFYEERQFVDMYTIVEW